MAHEIAIRGCVPIVPEMLGEIDWKLAMELDYSLVKASDAVFVYDSPWPSPGVDLEIEWAHELGKLVTMDLDELEVWGALHRQGG